LFICVLVNGGFKAKQIGIKIKAISFDKACSDILKSIDQNSENTIKRYSKTGKTNVL
jgi:hypothetical protein